MLCPDCREDLLVVECEGVEVDYCASCGGLWFDAGELDLALGGGARAEALAWRAEGRTSRRRCPACGHRLRTASHADTATEIDPCPRRHGIWLDRGELAALAGASGGASPLGAFLTRLFDGAQHAEAPHEEKRP